MEDNTAENSERTEDPKGHGDMSRPRFAENTQRILDEGIECGNDFVSLGIAGEALRAYAGMKEVNPPELAIYDSFIESYTGEAWDDLEVDMAGIMAELIAYAHEFRYSRDWETGTGLLDSINDTLALAAAMVRAGRWEVSRLKALADRTCQALASVSCRLGDLSQYAEDHTLIYMSDSEWFDQGILDVYAFWEVLAWLSPSRISLQVAVLRAARKERHIREAMQAFDAKWRRRRAIAKAVADYIANGPTK